MMVKVYERPQLPLPDPGPGMVLQQYPWHKRYMWDPMYYDTLGRDPLSQRDLWASNEDPKTLTEKVKELLKDYPSQNHRRQILFSAAVKGNVQVARAVVEAGVKAHPEIGGEQGKEGEADETVEGDGEKGKEKEAKGEESKDEGVEGKEGEEGEKDESADQTAEDGQKARDGESIQSEEKDDMTCVPIHVAALHHQLEIVKILIEEAHVPLEARDEIGRTPLIAASVKGGLEVVRYLLGQGADPTARMNFSGEIAEEYVGEWVGADALEFSAATGEVDMARLLLEHPFYGSTRKRKYRGDEEEKGVFVTPRTLSSAASSGSLEMVQFILDRGAYPLEDKDGKSKGELLGDTERQAVKDATATAFQQGDLASLKLLLSYTYPTDGDGNLLPFDLPPELAAKFPDGIYNAATLNQADKFRFLMGFGLKEPDDRSLNKIPDGSPVNTPRLLELAVAKGSLDMVRLLISTYGASPNHLRVPPGFTPLYNAAGNDQTEVMRYLLENFDMNIDVGCGRFASGPTALNIAITLRACSCVELLLQHGGPVEHVDPEILKTEEAMTAVITSTKEGRCPVRLLTEDNAKDYFADKKTLLLMVEVGPEDREWLRGLRARAPDEELRETGEGARELNEEEAETELQEGDVRQMMVDVPTFKEREAWLEEKDDREVLGYL